jgi:hypothetical protein
MASGHGPAARHRSHQRFCLGSGAEVNPRRKAPDGRRPHALCTRAAAQHAQERRSTSFLFFAFSRP